MKRAVFEKSTVEGYRTARTDGVAFTSQGRRVFAGTSDGSIVMYDCRLDTAASTRLTCSSADAIRKPKDKKPVLGLLNIESWRSLVGIVDGVLSVYDTQFPQNVTVVADQKGCHAFAVNEAHRTIVVANKKKLLQYSWQAPGFAFLRDFPLPDVPKSLMCVRNAVILGYRKHYECLDLVTGIATRILDVEREHRMLITEMSPSIFRPAALLLSLGLQGVILELDKVLAGGSFAYGSTTEERMDWGGLPVFCSIMFPFVVSGLPDSVEIHDLGSLATLQRIAISALGAHDLSFCSGTVELPSATQQQLGFVCNGEELSLLKMIPITKQVDELSTRGLYEEAIQLHSLCAANAPEYVIGVDVNALHTTAADVLLEKGEFDKAVKHYIDGNTEFISVLKHFPDLVPSALHGLVGIPKGREGEHTMSGAVLQRAATAVVHFCDYHRPKIIRRAQRSESLKGLGILDASMNSVSSGHSAALYHGSGLGKGTGRSGSSAHNQPHLIAAAGSGDDDDEYITDPDEEIRRAQLLDSVLLSALVNCQPPRRNATVQLLSSGINYCQVETCSVLLASQGNPFTEALLWLYRSHGLHSRVLDALKEDKTVAVGGWNKDQFYLWSADYLRWMWYHDSDLNLPKMALLSLRPLLEYDAELGLSTLLCRPQSLGSAVTISANIASLGRPSFGGRGLAISEVLAFLRTVTPKTVVRKSVPFGSAAAVAATATAVPTAAVSIAAAAGSTYSKYAALEGSTALQTVVSTTPLLTGHAVGVAFLECIIASGEAPSTLHDEFVQLLVDGMEAVVAAKGEEQDESTDLAPLQPIYRSKLQAFLLASTEYHPQRALKVLVPEKLFIKERALVESRLGEHESVLITYIHCLHDMYLAEWYCDRVHVAYRIQHSPLPGSRGTREVYDSEKRDANNSPGLPFPNTKPSFVPAGPLAALRAGPLAPVPSAQAPADLCADGPAPAIPGQHLNKLVRKDEGIVSGLRDAGDIYLIMFKVMLMDADEVRERLDGLNYLDEQSSEQGDDSKEENTTGGRGVGYVEEKVISLAEKYHDRVDAAQFLELLPESIPVASLLRYFKIVLEVGATQKRNLQIIHQLLRVREVNIRTNN